MIEIISNSDKKFEDVIGKNLHSFNVKNSKWIRENYGEREEILFKNFGAYNNGKLIGGAVGSIKYGWYFLAELWVDEKFRNNDVGTSLIKKIEEEVKANNALGIRTETWDFQARGFYEKNGFKVYAEFKDCPPGTIEYFLSKKV